MLERLDLLRHTLVFMKSGFVKALVRFVQTLRRREGAPVKWKPNVLRCIEESKLTKTVNTNV